MAKFTVKEVKEKFINEQVETNLAYLEKRLLENKPLADTFYDFSQKEGFSLAGVVSSKDNFEFYARLSDENNSETNDGQIVFTRKEFEDAVSAKKVLTAKTVSVIKKQSKVSGSI
jgi:hypothetical protein